MTDPARILLTNSVPATSVSAIHGLNFMIASSCRAFGSLSSGLLFAAGLRSDYLILPYWTMAFWSMLTMVIAFRLAKDPG